MDLPGHFGAFLLAQTVSVVIGGFFASGWVKYLHRAIEKVHPQARTLKGESVLALDISIGGVERFIATSLFLMNPDYAAAFIGAWVTLKFGANWGKREGQSSDDKIMVARFRLAALVGNAASLSFAVLVGLVLRCYLERS